MLSSNIQIVELVSEEHSTLQFAKEWEHDQDRFSILEEDYLKVMSELCDYPSMSKFADAYSAMFDYAYKVRENTLEITKSIKELECKNNIVVNRLNNVGELVNRNNVQLRALRAEVNDAKVQLDDVHAQEQCAMEIIDNLRHTLFGLRFEMSLINDMEQAENEEFGKHRKGLEREREKVRKQVIKLNDKYKTVLQGQSELEYKSDSMDAQIVNLTDNLDETTLELAKSKKIKFILEEEINNVKEELFDQNMQLITLNAQTIDDQHLVVNLDDNIKEQQILLLQHVTSMGVWNQKLTKLQDELNALKYAANTEELQHTKLEDELRIRVNAENYIKREIATCLQERNKAERKLAIFMKKSEAHETERRIVREELARTDNDIIQVKKVNYAEKRKIVDKIREKTVINQSVRMQSDHNEDALQRIAHHDAERKHLELKVEQEINKSKEQFKHINFLEKERDRLKDEAAFTSEHLGDLEVLSSSQKNQLYDNKQKLDESIQSLRKQNNLFESCIAEKTDLLLSLQNFVDRTAALKRDVEDYEAVILLYQNDIAGKNQTMSNMIKDRKKVSQITDAMQQELNDNLQEIHYIRQSISEHKETTKSLLTKIECKDFQLRENDKKITTLMGERDMVGAQMVARNQELFSLYHNLEFLTKMMKNGQDKYDVILNDICIMRKHILQMRQGKDFSEVAIKNMVDLKGELLELDKDLTSEMVRHKLLQDDALHPLNIHRWRKLQGSDPEKYKLLQMVYILQKGVMKNTNQISNKQLQLRELFKIYVTLRERVDKLPGPTIGDDIQKLKHTLMEMKNQYQPLFTKVEIKEIEGNALNLKLTNTKQELHENTQELMKLQKTRRNNLSKFNCILKQAEAYRKNICLKF